MNKKLHKEYSELQKHAEEFAALFKATPKKCSVLRPDGTVEQDFDFQVWSIVLYGQSGTPYAGRPFMITMDFPPEYPFKPPRVRFASKIFHPNISVEGDVCIDILKQNWTPAFGIEKILMSLLSLLDEPNGNDPLNHEAGRLFMEDRAIFNTRAASY